MPYVYAPGLGGLNLASHLLPGCSLSVLLKIAPSVSESWLSDTQLSPSGMTLRPFPLVIGEGPTCSPQDSLASLGASQESKNESKTNVGYGRELQSAFAWLDPHSSSWKTWLGSFLGDLNVFSSRWPLWGSMQHGVCFRAQAWEPVMCEKGSLYWPTPLARDHKRGSGKGRHSPNLSSVSISGPPIEELRAGSGFPVSCIRLNPRFVEWMMGLPEGYTNYLIAVESEPWGTACHHLLQQRLGLSYQGGSYEQHD